MNGVTLILLAYPCGYLADRFSREKTLRIAGVVGMVAVLTSVISFLRDDLNLIALSMSLWGVYAACYCPALESIFADSLQHGSRSTVFSWKHSVREISS